jgi:hypothetical protein
MATKPLIRLPYVCYVHKVLEAHRYCMSNASASTYGSSVLEQSYVIQKAHALYAAQWALTNFGAFVPSSRGGYFVRLVANTCHIHHHIAVYWWEITLRYLFQTVHCEKPLYSASTNNFFGNYHSNSLWTKQYLQYGRQVFEFKWE